MQNIEKYLYHLSSKNNEKILKFIINFSLTKIKRLNFKETNYKYVMIF